MHFRLELWQRQYCITWTELVATYVSILGLRHHLIGQNLTVRTDDGALEWLPNRNITNIPSTVFGDIFDMAIEFRLEGEHMDRDLSRMPPCERCQERHDDRRTNNNVEIYKEQDARGNYVREFSERTIHRLNEEMGGG